MDALVGLLVILNVIALCYLFGLHLPMVLLQIIQRARREEPLQADALALTALVLAFCCAAFIERTGWPEWIVYYVPIGIILLALDWIIGTILFTFTRTTAVVRPKPHPQDAA